MNAPKKSKSPDSLPVREMEVRREQARKRAAAAKKEARFAKERSREARRIYKQAKKVARQAKADLAALSTRLKSVLALGRASEAVPTRKPKKKVKAAKRGPVKRRPARSPSTKAARAK